MPEPHDTSPARVVVAVHSREVKTSLFLALNGVDEVSIVATANSTAELVSYGRALTPTFALVETGLPGRPLDEALAQLSEEAPECRVLLVKGPDHEGGSSASSPVEVFHDIEQLVSPSPETGSDRPRGT